MAEKDLLAAHKDHRRSYGDLLYVYPVLSRRSGGVSIGVNLNPDKACNFDCVYCEVDRTTPGRVKKVHLGVLAEELRFMIGEWKSGALFERAPFAEAPAAWRRLNDIAFSGDGEPTTCPVFEQAVDVAFRIRDELTPPGTKLVLISDAGCFDRPGGQAGLRRMRQGAHEIWAKLDAGTEDYFKLVNRTRIAFARILQNITETARWCPLVVQSLFLRVKGQPPSPAEIDAYCARLGEIRAGGGQLLGLQIYTVARPTPEAWATALTDAELDAVVARVREKTGLPIQVAYGNAAA